MFEGAILVLKVPSVVGVSLEDAINTYMVRGDTFSHVASLPVAEQSNILEWVNMTHVRLVAFEPDDGISGLYTKKD